MEPAVTSSVLAKQKSASRLEVSVLVPTWRRPDDLERCLLALANQHRLPDQVIVTVRDDDVATWARLSDLRGATALRSLALEPLSVPPGPLTLAMSAGLGRSTGDVVALTDDDSEPRPDWIERILPYFNDLRVGGVGGRDFQRRPISPSTDGRNVGMVSWFGRIAGNHHLGVGGARDVQVLKGVNCCFRGHLLREVGFDLRLAGSGTVIHWEMTLCLALRRQGWRLVYDPAVATDHHVAARQDADTNHRGIYNRQGLIDNVHNETLALLEHLSPAGRAAFRAWSAAVGTRAAPGLLQVFRLGLQRGDFGHEWRRFRATVAGRREGRRTWRQSQLDSSTSPPNPTPVAEAVRP